jgi:arylsulfatase A-like enzyme
MARFCSRVRLCVVTIATLFGCAAGPLTQHTGTANHAPRPRVIVFVWDGLRPDSVDAALTPRLAALAERGTLFTDQHAMYPTFTMMNAATFATGAFPGQTGFYGNTLWQPNAMGADSAGNPLPFAAPIFTEDYWVLDALNTSADGHLLLTETLFDAAQRAGLRTAAVGKSGAACMQDLGKGDVVLDER